jgi:hypothetical protein
MAHLHHIVVAGVAFLTGSEFHRHASCGSWWAAAATLILSSTAVTILGIAWNLP